MLFDEAICDFEQVAQTMYRRELRARIVDDANFDCALRNHVSVLPR
jgi:hypothetical protein